MLGASADYLAAGEHIRLVWHGPPPTMWAGHTNPSDLFDTYVSFTDAAGLRWERRGRRQPTRVWSYKHSDLMPAIVPPDAPPYRPEVNRHTKPARAAYHSTDHFGDAADLDLDLSSKGTADNE
jgi:hypothetical protein